MSASVHVEPQMLKLGATVQDLGTKDYSELLPFWRNFLPDLFYHFLRFDRTSWTTDQPDSRPLPTRYRIIHKR